MGNSGRIYKDVEFIESKLLSGSKENTDIYFSGCPNFFQLPRTAVILYVKAIMKYFKNMIGNGCCRILHRYHQVQYCAAHRTSAN
jgi:hypothetical protein